MKKHHARHNAKHSASHVQANRRSASHHKAHHAHQTELLALTMFVIFTAYMLLLSNTAVSATALASGSVVYADNPVNTAGLAAAGTNSYSIALMWILSLVLLAPVEIWLRKK